MASVFLSSILSKTSQALGCVRKWAVSPSSSSDPRSSVLKDLEKLERTLKRIQAVLHDAEEREIRDESAVKLWLKELKEVAYQADDVLDEYQYEVLRAQVEGRASGRKRKRVEGDDEEEVSIPDGMGDTIREIRERFDEISQDRERLCLREEDGKRRVLEAPYPAPTSHKMDESAIYERERDKQEVIKLLFSEDGGNGISVVPIVGKGGLGKTTIAQLVYNDSKVKEKFDLTGWVCVSDDFDVQRLTKDILESLTQSPCDLTQLSTLQDKLEEKLKGKRVLLVLDDVWNEQQSRWESLRNPFVGAETVKIIVTCRNYSVAEIMQTVRPYHPGCLSQEQSWSLFRHYAFRGRDPEEQPRLADIGKQIVRKCSGLPLAVKSIGSLLRYIADEDRWMDVMQSDVWEVDENNEILPALRLSYSRMPAHLKPCFVYCSMFPKDYEFDGDELVRLWMAQGYIQTCGGRRRMDDAGNEYFNDLQRRSFFDSYRSKFKMHDMIHDLAKSIAENECWAIVDKKLPSLPNEVRHLYIGKSLRCYNFSALRTLLLQLWYGDRRVIPEIIKNLPLLRCLRTLQFCWQRKDEIPDLFGNLKHLRYLWITSYEIEKLPESICLLYHLQILVLDCENLAELPNSLGNLTKLHHIQIANKVILSVPAGIEKLTNLQSLLGHYKVQGGIGVLKNLVNLQTLIISRLKNMVNIEDARDAGLKHKYKLEQLFLHWNATNRNCAFHNSRHHKILHLEAEYKDVPADEKREEAMLEYLQPHANLKKLLMEGYGGSKFPEWVGNPFSFASLQEISIMDCEKIRHLPLYNLDAPISKSMLHSVHISGCWQLTSIAGLHHLHSLTNLNIYNCPQLRLLSEEGLPSNVYSLHIKNCPQLWLLLEEGLPSNIGFLCIEECQQLTSLSGMQKLICLEILIIKACSQLQLLLEGGLPSSVRYLHIEECRQLTSLLGIPKLICLEILIIKNCPQLRFLSEEGLPSNLQDLHIEECQSLTSLPGMQKLIHLDILTIKNCPQLQLLSEERLPSKLYRLQIEECQQLTSLSGMQYLTSLKELFVQNCPKLHIMAEDQLSSMPNEVKIVDCPGSINWCQIQNINCIQVTSGNKLTLSNTWLKIRHWFDDLTSVEHLCFSNSWKLLRLRDSTPVLEELTIWGCTKIPPLQSLPKLTSLRSLVIKNCPRVQVLEDGLFPSTLKSLVVDGCEDLMFLQLAQQSRDALEELQLVNCPKLEQVEGLNCLFFPKIISKERCPQLRLPQNDRQPSILPRVELAEETENKETIDDGTRRNKC